MSKCRYRACASRTAPTADFSFRSMAQRNSYGDTRKGSPFSSALEESVPGGVQNSLFKLEADTDRFEEVVLDAGTHMVYGARGNLGQIRRSVSNPRLINGMILRVLIAGRK